MKRRRVGDPRYFKHPITGIKVAASRIVDIADGGWLDGDWGKCEFEAWLEEDLKRPGYFYNNTSA